LRWQIRDKRIRVHGGKLLVGDPHFLGLRALVELGETFNPVLVVVAAIRLMMTSWLTSGLPRQLMLMKLNRQCRLIGYTTHSTRQESCITVIESRTLSHVTVRSVSGALV